MINLKKKFDSFSISVYLFTFFVAGNILIFTANGTCDEGDSITHYQYARYAPLHLNLFFHHWAKPLFVLLACPFSQFGFTGIKFFNLLLSTVSMWFAFQIAVELKIKRAPLIALFLCMMPGWIVHSLSGLTEPMFAFTLSGSIFLYLRGKIARATLLISFLPFVRSEGLIMCCVFGALLLIEKRWKVLPLLLFGHVFYAIAGFCTHHSFLWIFTKIPYAKMSSVYGTGNWEHFFINTPFITGIPLYGLFLAGIFFLAFKIFSKNFLLENKREFFLVYGCALSYFLAHVVFWALGIFNSMGLLRVLIAVLPLFAVIQLRGFNLVDFLPAAFPKKIVFTFLLASVVLFPFTGNKFAWSYKKQFDLTVGQIQVTNAVQLMKAKFPEYKNSVFYYDASYVSLLLDLDPFDESVSRPVWKVWSTPHTKSEFVFWDDWFSAFEMSMPLESVDGNPHFERVQEFLQQDEWGREKRLILFKSTY